MRSRWLAFAIALAAALASALFWSRLPAEVATHWNVRGEADGWSSRAKAAIMLPLFIAAIGVGLRLLPRIDPRRENYEKFRDVYWLVGNTMALFFAVLHLAVLASAAGIPVDTTRVAVGAVAILFLVFGNYLGRIRPNWFLGIRTPWTLDSAEVWRKTHRVGGWLFVGAGAVIGIAVLIPGAPLPYIVIGALAAAALATVALSFVFWYREKHS